MELQPTPLAGAFVVDLSRLTDERGFFARTFCRRVFAERGLESEIAQSNVSFNQRRGTLRGLHFQAEPHGEAKLITCVQGAVWDVIVDLRPDSPTFAQHFAMTLEADARRAVYVPRGMAHGFQSLVDNAVVSYQMFNFFEATAARGIRWNDPRLAIPWPVADPILSPRDQAFPLLDGFPVGI